MKTIIVFCFLALASSSFAQRMVLDRSFGDSGMVNGTVYGKGMRFNQKIVPLSDGKSLCLGEYLNNFGSMQPAIFKFNSNGVLDTTFNGDGILHDSIEIIRSLPFNYPPRNFMSVQPDGRIYKAGSTPKGTFFNTIISCNDPNGNPIVSFGKNGVLMLDTIENLYSPFLVGFSSFSTNEIIACWMGYYNNVYSYVLSKFDSTGCIDRSFGTEGFLIFRYSISRYYVDAITVLKDGSIICAGSDHNEINKGVINERTAIIKLNSDGTFNNNFGIGGRVIIDVDPKYISNPYYEAYLETARSVVELEDHRLVFSVITDRNNCDYVLRLMPDGGLDKSFGKDGISEGLTHIYDIAVLKDGSIIACNNQSFTHFLQNGIADSSAQAKIPISIMCVALQDDNKILFGGVGYYDATHIFPFIVRLTNDSTVFVSQINAQTKKVSISPLPFKDEISFKSGNSVIQNISIYDLNGRCVLSRRVFDKTCTLNTDLTRGVYLCKILTSKGFEYHKIVSTWGIDR